MKLYLNNRLFKIGAIGGDVTTSSRLLALSLLSLCALARSEPATFVAEGSDVVAAFPELRGDKKLSACSNSIMSGATQFVFLSDTRQNEVTIKTVQCSRVDKGLSCGAVRQAKHYFLESPERSFSLENLTFETARKIVEAYQAGRISAVPDWFGAARPHVRAIKALPDGGYKLHFGDVYCGGCRAEFNVRLEADGIEPRLLYLGDADGACF